MALGEARRAEMALFFQNVIAVVVFDHPIDRAQIDRVEQGGPASVEAFDAGDQIARHQPTAPVRPGLIGPDRSGNAAERPEPVDRRREHAGNIIRTGRHHRPLPETHVNHVEQPLPAVGEPLLEPR